MHKDLISIIMPIYNAENYLEKSIQSVLNQDYIKYELLLVNDGSRDSSETICLQYARNYEQIRLLNKRNEGVSSARNFGMKHAQGEYITFLDADDLWEPTFLSLMHDKITSNAQIHFVASEYDKLIDKTGKKEKDDWEYRQGRFDVFVHYSGEFRPPFHIGGIMIKRKLLEKYSIRFHSGYQYSEDVGFFLKVLCVTEVHFVKRVLEHYRIHNNSATSKPWDIETHVSTVLIYNDAISYCQQYYPQKLELMKYCRDYKAYRFIRDVLQLDTAKAIYYINQWQDWLKEFIKNKKGKASDRLKAYIMLNRNKTLLYFCRSHHEL